MGRDILSGAPQQQGDSAHAPPIWPATLRRPPRPFSWVEQRLVREPSIDQLSPEACALSLLLVTVADAQGVSYYAEHSLCQRVSMAPSRLRQARQRLIPQGLGAYRRPLSQVVALEGQERAEAACLQPHDDPVDLKAVFQQIWEVWA